MPHLRKRLAMPLLKKKLGFSRIVSIQGPRQCGKSFLVRKLYSEETPQARYVSLDSKSQAYSAENRPSSFIEDHLPAHPLIIDEAQKAPSLFDELKLRVDQQNTPGQFIILGSTEFAKENQIRESLTGRLSRLRLFTFTLREAQALPPRTPVNRRQLMQHLRSGGFPAFFAVRDSAEREQLVQDWLQTTVQRDLQQFHKVKLSPDLAFEILRALSLCEEPTVEQVASQTKKSSRMIATYIRYLSILFVIHKLEPSVLGTGKTRYYMCDVGLAHWFGASFERQLESWALHEFLARASYTANVRSTLSYYRTSKGSIIHFIKDSGIPTAPLTAIKILENEKFDLRDLEILKALEKKCGKSGIKIQLQALGHESSQLKKDRIFIHPWESVA